VHEVDQELARTLENDGLLNARSILRQLNAMNDTLLSQKDFEFSFLRRNNNSTTTAQDVEQTKTLQELLSEKLALWKLIIGHITSEGTRLINSRAQELEAKKRLKAAEEAFREWVPVCYPIHPLSLSLSRKRSLLWGTAMVGWAGSTVSNNHRSFHHDPP